jgi:hypothetical protein
VDENERGEEQGTTDEATAAARQWLDGVGLHGHSWEEDVFTKMVHAYKLPKYAAARLPIRQETSICGLAKRAPEGQYGQVTIHTGRPDVKRCKVCGDKDAQDLASLLRSWENRPPMVERIESLTHGDIHVWSEGEDSHAHRYTPTSTVIAMMSALVVARDCIVFDGSLDKENDTIIANRAIDRIDAALAKVEHLDESRRRQEKWDAEQDHLAAERQKKEASER